MVAVILRDTSGPSPVGLTGHFQSNGRELKT